METTNIITKNIKSFVPPSQIEVIKQGLKGEEKDYFQDTLVSLDKIIEEMPKTYGTDGIKLKDKIAQLHYFSGSSDWYIVEKDSEPEQLQAFGYVILNGDTQNAELGYINIEELKGIKSVEIDLHFTPKKLGEIIEKKDSKVEEQSEKQTNIDMGNPEIRYKDLKSCLIAEGDDEALYLFEGKKFINKESGNNEKWEITGFFKYGIIVNHIPKNKLADKKNERRLSFVELRNLYQEKDIEIDGIDSLKTLDHCIKLIEKCIDNIDLKEETAKTKKESEEAKKELSEIKAAQKAKEDKEKANNEMAKLLMKFDSQAWTKLNIRSGSQLYSDLELQEKYKDILDKKTKEANLSYPLDMGVNDILEFENFHSLNQYLYLSGAYGEKEKSGFIEQVEKYKTDGESPYLNLHIFSPEPVEKLTKEVLASRLKILKKMDEKNPSAVLKTRIKLINKMLANPEKFCCGGEMNHGGYVPENLVPELKDIFPKAIEEFGITEIFIQDGEVRMTSDYDIPMDYAEKIESFVLRTNKDMVYKTPSNLGGTFNVRYIGKEGDKYLYENVSKGFEGQIYKYDKSELVDNIMLLSVDSNMASGGGIRKAKFKDREKVYSWQNPNELREISHIRDNGVHDGVDYGFSYKVSLRDKDGYSYSSKWMGENSLSKTKKDEYAKGGYLKENEMTSNDNIGFIPMNLEESLSHIARFGGTDINGVIGILSAMIDSGLSDDDLKTPHTKTGAQYEKAKDKKTKEIWAIIEPNYKGEFKGNMYYSTIKRLVEREDAGDNILKRFKPFRKYQKDSVGGSLYNKGGNIESIGKYTKGDEGMFQGDDVRILKVYPYKYSIANLDEEGDISLLDANIREVSKSLLDDSFAKFPLSDTESKKDLLQIDDMVWNEEGNKLEVVNKNRTQYTLVGFKGTPKSYEKKQIEDYIKSGKWTLKPKYEEGGQVNCSQGEDAYLEAMAALNEMGAA